MHFFFIISLFLLCIVISNLSFKIVEPDAVLCRRKPVGLLSVNLTENFPRGIAFCASDRMLRYYFRTVYQLRYIWNSTLPFLVAHCSEISPPSVKRIYDADPCVDIIDVCDARLDNGKIFGMDVANGRKRLRSFYCKIAALYYSNFNETMIIDLDTIWFKSPEIAFNYSGYISSGALFFRDRVSIQDRDRGDRPSADDLRQFFVSKNVSVTTADALRNINKGGSYAMYWRYIAGSAPFLNEYQDSSLVIIDKRSHGRMLSILKELVTLPNLGYGDKELFWIAAFISGESYVFEPFFAAQYGDCYGLILHYDPTDEGHPEKAEPFYVNAEYMVETEHLHAVGSFLRNEITKPILINSSSPVTEMKTYSLSRNCAVFSECQIPGCTCPQIGCAVAPSQVNFNIVQTQWLTFSLVLNKSSAACIPVVANSANVVGDVVRSFSRTSHCNVAGCSYLEDVNQTLSWRKDDLYCDPIAFYAGFPPSTLREAAKKARTPLNPLNVPDLQDGQAVGCGQEKPIYLYSNKTLRMFPNFHSFLRKGLALSNVSRFGMRLCNRIEKGPWMTDF